MSARPDVVVRDDVGNTVAIVEIKNRESLSPEIATELHRNMAAHGLLESARYFLLLSQDSGYLWHGSAVPALDAPPLAQFPMNSVIQRYTSELTGGERLRGTELEFVVLQWFTDLRRSHELEQYDGAEPESALARTGFLEALRTGNVELELFG